MKILLTDIETSPATAYIWGIFKETIPLSRIIDTSRCLCWSAKWRGEKKVMYDSVHDSSPEKMLFGIHDLLDEADVVVHYNGQQFDIPILNREFLIHGMNPPAPFKQVDLLQVVRKKFRFISNKLAHISNALGIEGKENSQDFTLWVRCMAGEDKAWQEMKRYNQKDVTILEELYERLLPWIPAHPNHGLYSGGTLVCPNCGSSKYQRRGYAWTNALKYARLQCSGCHTWFRSLTREEGVKRKFAPII